MNRIPSAILLVAAYVFAAAGCEQAPSYPAAHLAGTVTVNNQPVESGSVSFLPQTRGPAVGAKIVKGRYDCRYVPLGKHVVTIHAMRDTGRFDSVGDARFPIQESIVPPKSQGGIVLTVAGDNLSQDFDL